MKYIQKTLLSAGLLAAAGAVAPMTASAQTQSLVVTSFVGQAHTINNAVFGPLDQILRAGTAGQLSLNVRHGGISTPPLQYSVIAQGDAQLGWALPAYTPQQFSRTMIAELPIIPAGVPGYQLLWNAWDAGVLTSEFPGTRPLALWVSEPAVIISRNKPIRTPADLAGLRVRISTHPRLIEAMGATAVGLTAGELYNALQTGQIDVIITGSSAIADFRLNEVATYYTLGAPLGQVAFMMVMNQGAYNSLSAARRTLLDQFAGRQLSCQAELGWLTTAHLVVNALRADPTKTVIDLTPAEIAAFGAITSQVTDTVVASTNGGAAALSAMLGTSPAVAAPAPTQCDLTLRALGNP